MMTFEDIKKLPEFAAITFGMFKDYSTHHNQSNHLPYSCSFIIEGLARVPV